MGLSNAVARGGSLQDWRSRAASRNRPLFVHELPVSDPMRPVRIRSLPLPEVLGVVAITPFKPHRLRIPLEREYVRCDAIQEPAIVRYDDGASRETNQRLLERAE